MRFEAHNIHMLTEMCFQLDFNCNIYFGWANLKLGQNYIAWNHIRTIKRIKTHTGLIYYIVTFGIFVWQALLARVI